MLGSGRVVVLLTVALFAGGFAVVVPAMPAVAAASGSLAFVVNTTTDAPDATPGDGVCADLASQCTLRAAIEESNAAAPGTATSVSVPAGTYKLTLGVLAILHNSVAITGAGAKATILSNKGKHQVVSIAANSEALLAGLELTKGGAGTKGGGGGTNAGTTTLSDVTVTKNTARQGGGISNSSGARLSLIDSTVSANTATSGLDSQPGNPGGGIYNAGMLTISGSTITGNIAGSGGLGLNDTAGGGGSGGGIDNVGSMTATNSTISANFAGSGGPGVQEVPGKGGDGGAIYSAKGSVTLSGTTVSGNSAGYGGASEGDAIAANAGNGGGVWSSGTLQVTGSTFSSNTAGNGGSGGGTGGSGAGLFTKGRATISSSTFTGNTAGVATSASLATAVASPTPAPSA